MVRPSRLHLNSDRITGLSLARAMIRVEDRDMHRCGRKSRVCIAAAVLAFAGVSEVSLGQSAPRPLDAGIEDINSLRTSLRVLPPVMRHDTAFEHVYRSPLDSQQHYRVAGGLYAVFNSSQYAATPYGAVPVYPAGVQFHIGPPRGFDGSQLDPATAAFLRETDPRFDHSAADRPELDAPVRRPRPVTVRPESGVVTIGSEGVRQQRLREITAKALRKAGLDG